MVVGTVAFNFEQVEMTIVSTRLYSIILTMRLHIMSCYTDALAFFDKKLEFKRYLV